MTKEKAQYPIFDIYPIDQLVKITTYSEVYLQDIKSGHQKARPKFRAVIAKELNMSEDALFTLPECSECEGTNLRGSGACNDCDPDPDR
jgi:hypothetical protein